MRYGMVIDLAKCIGCNACTMACKQYNGVPSEVFWSRVLVEERGEYPTTRLHFRPVLCNHCKNAPCVRACPTGASHFSEGGIVDVDASKCIGCGACIVACPYSARTRMNSNPKSYFPGKVELPLEVNNYKNFVRGTVTKCTFCKDRLAQGEEPACVKTCVTKARIFGELDDPASEISRVIARRNALPLLKEIGTEPSVYYLPR
jgi:dimethyl sulfoxide reductase iron-sulfur subunit